MLKSSFSAILILTLCMACIGRAAVLQDDINTFALWHGDTIVGANSPDDTSITARTAIPLIINGGAAPVTIGTGYYGNALDYGTNGRQWGTVGTTWPAFNTAIDDAPGNEVKLDGWYYIPNIAALPIPATAGGSGAATVYTFQISSSSAGGTRCYLAVNPLNVGANYGTASLDWQKTNNGSTIKLPMYRYYRDTGLPVTDSNALDLTGKWLHIVAYAQYSNAAAPSWDPNYNRTRLEVTDPVAGKVYATEGANTNYLGGSSNSVWVGHISGKAGCSPYRGWRGKIDELKLSTRVHAPMVAYGPTPVSGTTVSANPNLPVSWHMAAPFNPADTITQDVWKGTNATFNASDPNWSKVATGVTGNTATIGPVIFGQTYWWKVDSIDSAGGVPVTRPSSVWSFNVNDIAPTVDLGLDLNTYLVAGTRTIAFTPTVVDPDTELGLLTYQWTQLAGPSCTIVSPTAKNTNIIFTATGSYFFQLTVNDGTFSGSDIVRVRVFSTACGAAQANPVFTRQSTDFNNDCKVNFIDFASFAANWVKCNSADPACI